MADGDVPLHGEGGEGESRGVHGEELAVDHQGAAGRAPHPVVAQDVVGEDLLRHGGHQGDQVRDGEADEVAVGGGVEGLGAAHGHHHHGVAEHAGQQDGGLEHGAHQSVHRAEVLGVLAPRQAREVGVLRGQARQVAVLPRGAAALGSVQVLAH